MVDTKIEKAAQKVASTIDQRTQQKTKANATEASYAASTRRHRTREQEQNRLEWIAVHTHLYRSHARLASEHAAKAVATGSQRGSNL